MATNKDDATLQLAFQNAIEHASHLEWKPGLQAIRKSEGGGQILCDNPKDLLGGAAMDDDCRCAYPNSNRWDYVLGYRRDRKAVAFFIEVHSAETSDVSKLEDKLRWLREYLQEDAQKELASLPKEIHWVASGRINIPKHLPQFKRLATTLRKLGLQGPIKQLKLA